MRLLEAFLRKTIREQVALFLFYIFSFYLQLDQPFHGSRNWMFWPQNFAACDVRLAALHNIAGLGGGKRAIVCEATSKESRNYGVIRLRIRYLTER